MKFTKRTYFFLFLSLLSLVLYAYGSAGHRAEFVSFDHATIQEGGGCEESVPASVDGTSSVISIKEQTCKLSPFTPPSSVIRVHYFIPETGEGEYAARIYQNEVVVKEIDLRTGRNELPSWRTIYIDIREQNLNMPVQLEFLGTQLEVRKRIEYLTAVPDNLILTVKGNLKPGLYKTIPVTLFMAILAFMVVASSKMSRVMYFCVLFLASTLMFFSDRPFYYFDEWHIVQRLHEIGISGVWFLHLV